MLKTNIRFSNTFVKSFLFFLLTLNRRCGMFRNMMKTNQYRENNDNWKGGRRKSGAGYWTILKPDHLRANNSYVFEHIIITEKALGKPLPPKVQVHHHGAKDDNTQIVICQNQAYHTLLHVRMRALKTCGHASWRKCKYCKQYDRPEKLTFSGTHCYHSKCHNKYTREKYALKTLSNSACKDY